MNQENNIPKHIVLFPDGNRRWARERGLDTLEGHRAGYENLIPFCKWCQSRGAEVITAFGFSSENWNRTEREVSYLMTLLEEGVRKGFRDLGKHDVQLRIIGQKERLPESLQQAIVEAEEETKQNSFVLNLGVSYGGRWDITQAARKIVEEGITPDAITEDSITERLTTAGLPDPDLIIRAGGEKRLSNFLLWQGAYAELYFSDKYWPDFTEQDLDDAFAEYAKRQRRFGH